MSLAWRQILNIFQAKTVSSQHGLSQVRRVAESAVAFWLKSNLLTKSKLSRP